MKLILFILLFVIYSCGKDLSYDSNANYINPKNNNGNSNPEVITQSLVAQKSYLPISYIDGVYNPSEPYYFEIPIKLSVIHGNAGNWTAKIIIDNYTYCVYKGGSSFTNPLYTNNTTEINNGKFYYFSHCYNETSINSGYKPNDKIYLLDQLRISIDNGDNQMNTSVYLSFNLTK